MERKINKFLDSFQGVVPPKVLLKRNQRNLYPLFLSIENEVMIDFAARLQTHPADLILHNKCTKISEMRQLYFLLRNEMHAMSYTDIALEMGRDRTTVCEGIANIKGLLESKDERVVGMWNKVKNVTGKMQEPYPKKEFELICKDRLKQLFDDELARRRNRKRRK